MVYVWQIFDIKYMSHIYHMSGVGFVDQNGVRFCLGSFGLFGYDFW